jgi:hypothetical protein
MKKETLIKAALIFGGGYLLFWLAKQMKKPTNQASLAGKNAKKSFDSKDAQPDVQPTPENAKIVYTAYVEAMNAGESPARLTELNKECMKEFGMRCYLDENKNVIVCDVKGNPVEFE